MTQSTVAPFNRIVTVGVETHRDIHVAAALDRLGWRLGTTTIPTTPKGYRQLEAWARQFGSIEAFGIEGHQQLGRRPGARAAPARPPPGRGQPSRPRRPPPGGQERPLDAEAAGRAVLAGTATAQPKPARVWWR